MSEARKPKRKRHLFDLPVAEDVNREVRFHIESKVEELMAQGWTREAARAEAERRFGDVHAVQDECRDITVRHRRSVQRASAWETVWQDVRFGARTLIRRPAFTVVAALTLALGVGANAAVFAVIQRLLLAPLPFGDADRLVRLWEISESGNETAFTEPNILDVRERVRSLEAVAVHPTFSFGGAQTVLGGSRPVRRNVSFVSGDFFRVVQVPAALGRLPEPAEAAADGPPVAVVSHAFWSDLLNAERELADLSVEIGATRYQIVGVMPRGYDYPSGSAVWIPTDAGYGGDRTSHNYAAIARVRAGTTIEDAAAEVSALGRSLKQQYGDQMDAVDFRLKPMREELYGDYRRPLLLLIAAAAAVLLIACTNLASTLLARSSARTQEFAVRAALGAGRPRVVRQLVTESLLLALLGAVCGTLLAAASLRVLTALSPSPALRSGDITVGPVVIAFSLGAAVLASLIFGLLPAISATRTNLASTLREGGRGGGGPRTGIWNALVISEAALAIVLLVSAALLLRAFVSTLDADPGFDANGVIVAEVSIPATHYPNDTTVALLHERVLQTVRGLPGVETAGAVGHLPFAGVAINGGLEIEGLPDAQAYSDYGVATTGYFETLRVPLLQGRLFEDTDRIGTPTVAVVNRTFVERFMNGQNPVGRRIRNLSNDSWYYGQEAWLTIVGVVDDIRHRGYLARLQPAVFVCGCQRAVRLRDAYIVVRPSSAPGPLIAALRAELARIEPDMPVDFTTMPDVMRATIADRRFSLIVLGAFAGLALLLSAVGIYGVVSYAVARRRRELGIRLALGAVPGRVTRLVIRNAVGVVAIGVLIGLVAAFGATRLITAQLAGTTGLDGRSIIGAAALLLIVAFLASWIPARRIGRIDPLSTLRSD